MLEENIFVEAIPWSVQRSLAPDKMALCRAPFEAPGAGRLQTLVFPRELPIGGEPADVVGTTKEDAAFMAASEIAKLLILVGEGTAPTKRQREDCPR